MVRHDTTGTTWSAIKEKLFDSIKQSYESFRPDYPPNIKDNDVVNMVNPKSHKFPNGFIIYRKITMDGPRLRDQKLTVSQVSSLAGILWKSENPRVKEYYQKLAQDAEIIYKQKGGQPLHMIHYDSERAASKSTLNTIKLEEPNCGSPAVINPSNNLNNSIDVQITPISESHVPINVNYDNSNNHSEFQQNFISDTNLEVINYSVNSYTDCATGNLCNNNNSSTSHNVNQKIQWSTNVKVHYQDTHSPIIVSSIIKISYLSNVSQLDEDLSILEMPYT
nr:15744_t:CDS:2 [Entrophospora candida]